MFQWFKKNGHLRQTVHLQPEILTAKTEFKKYFFINKKSIFRKGKFIFSKEKIEKMNKDIFNTFIYPQK